MGTEVWIGNNGQVPIPDSIPDADVVNVGASLRAGLSHDLGTCLDTDTHPSSIHLLSEYIEEEDPLNLGFHLG